MLPEKIKILYNVTWNLRASSLRTEGIWVNRSRWARNVAEKECTLFVEKSGRNKPLGSPRCRWSDNTETGFEDRMSGHRLDSAG